jgi:drug/metabolite transporter (DMT)-like permease
VVVFLLVVLVGGSNFVAVSVNVEEMPPFWSAGIRFLGGAVILLGIMRWRRTPTPRGRDLVVSVAFGGLYFGAFYALLYWALQRVPAGVGSLVISAAPLLTLLLAVAHSLERLNGRTLVGGLLAVLGIALVSGPSVGKEVAVGGLVALVGAAICLAEAEVIVKAYAHAGPIPTNAIGMIVGSVLLLATSLIVGESWALPTRPESWVTLMYLIPAGTFTLVGVLYVLTVWSASATAFATVLFPVVAVGLDAVLGRTAITAPMVGGGVVVVAGVWIGIARKGQFAFVQALMSVRPGGTSSRPD